MYDRILVPLDGSELSNAALDHAKELANEMVSQSLPNARRFLRASGILFPGGSFRSVAG